MTELRKLANWIVDLKAENIPDRVINVARLCVLDTVGVAIGGFDNPLMKQIMKTYVNIGGESKKAGLWGQKEKTSLQTAIFLNAMASHMLELDDVHTRSKTHIGSVVVPAAWGLSEYLEAKGRDFLIALIAGYEAVARIGMAFGVTGHRNRGWHATSTAGTFGAAAACGKLLGLSEDEMVWALGMAGTQSFGLWAFLGDGANSKALHPARAAISGCEAAFLAKSGMTGPEHILTAQDGGLFTATSEGYDVKKVVENLGVEWEIMHIDKKPYPCCRSSHCAIDAALALRNRERVYVEEIEKITVDTYAVGYKQCGISKSSLSPENPMEAKFSTPYVVAMSLLKGEINLSSFDQANVEDENVQRLLKKVQVRPDEEFSLRYPDHWGCRLTIYMKDGRTLGENVYDASGSVVNPLNEEQTKKKAFGLMQGIPQDKRDEIIAEILDIYQKDLMPCLNGI